MKCPKCQIEIKEHPANACLDALFAELVMEWRIIQIPGPNYPWTNRELWRTPDGAYIGINDWYPSTNISHAMEGEEKVKELDQGYRYIKQLSDIIHHDTGQWPNGFMLVSANPHQRTRALILWALEKE